MRDEQGERGERRGEYGDVGMFFSDRTKMMTNVSRRELGGAGRRKGFGARRGKR